MFLGIPEIHVFLRMDVVSIMIVKLHGFCWGVMRISIPEGMTTERQDYMQLQGVMGIYGVSECEESVQLTAGQRSF